MCKFESLQKAESRA